MKQDSSHFTKEAQKRTSCFHCGDPLVDRIVMEDKVFCCHGCATVYDLLHSNGLEQYYELNQSPGKKSTARGFDFLDNESIVSELLDFENTDVAKVTFFIPSIHCSSCIWLLENLTKVMPGVTQSRVFFVKKELQVTYSKHHLTMKNLVLFLNKIGYAPEINLASETKAVKKSTSLQGIKIAVAGFCFGNSMLLSLPDYLDSRLLLEENFRGYFGLLNLALALPVFFFSATDYFKSAFGSLRQRYLNIDVPIALGILALFSRSLWEVATQVGIGYSDSLTGLVFFLLIGKWFQNKSYQALSFERDYKSFFPIAVKRVSGVPEYVRIEDLRIGDELELHHQEILPTDGLLVEGRAQMDYSFVTGESMKEEKHPGELLYAGGRHYGPPIRVMVQKEVVSSYLTSLWNQDSMKEARGSASTTLINQVSTYFTWAILMIASFAATYWVMHDVSLVWEVVTSVLIVACPCALALSVPFAFGHTLRFFGRNQLYLKNSEVIEQLAGLKDIVFDKTGTLTTLDHQQIYYQGRLLTAKELVSIHSVASNSIHPLSRQLARHLSGYPVEKLDSFAEESGAGIQANIGPTYLKIGSAAYVGAVAENHPEGASVWIRINDEVVGAYFLRPAYREGLFDRLVALRQKYRLHVLSGDTDQERPVLTSFFDVLKFNQKPADKLKYISSLEQQTLMIGDGLNDAGALHQAQVGISVAEDLHQFSPSCDAILRGDSLVLLPVFLRMSRYAMKVVYFAFALSFLYNLVGLYFAVTGQLTPITSAILMPLSSISVVGLITFLIYFKGKRLFKSGNVRSNFSH